MNKKVIFLSFILSFLLISCFQNKNDVNNSVSTGTLTSTGFVDKNIDSDLDESEKKITYKNKTDLYELSFSKDLNYTEKDSGVVITDGNTGVSISTSIYKNKFTDLKSYVENNVKKLKTFAFNEIRNDEVEINGNIGFKVSYSMNVGEVEILTEQYFFENIDKNVITISSSTPNPEEVPENTEIIKSFNLIKK